MDNHSLECRDKKCIGCGPNAPLRRRIKKLEQWVSDLQSGLYINCVYCGHNYGPKEDTPAVMADVLKEHIEKCPSHPLSEAKKRIEELEAELEQEKRQGIINWCDNNKDEVVRTLNETNIELVLENEELKNQLLLIGDKAVCDWDGETVGQVDAAVPKVTQTYVEWARDTLDCARKYRAQKKT